MTALKQWGINSLGGVGNLVARYGGNGFPLLLAVLDGEAAIGAEQMRVGLGVAITADPDEVIEVRPLTEPVKILMIEFWPGAPLPEGTGTRAE